MRRLEIPDNHVIAVDEQRQLARGLAALQQLEVPRTQKGWGELGEPHQAVMVSTIFPGIGNDDLRYNSGNAPGIIAYVSSSPAVVPDNQSWEVDFYSNGRCAIPHSDQPVPWDEGVGEILSRLRGSVISDVDRAKIERALTALNHFAE